MKRFGKFLILAGLALMPLTADCAQVRYSIQPLVKAGDSIGALQIPTLGGNFSVLGLDDTGRMDFFTDTNPDGDNPRIALIEDAAGQFTPLFRGGDPLGNLLSPTLDLPAADVNSSGQVVFALVDSSQHRTFVQYSAGKLSVIATEGGNAPGGKWQSLDILQPLMMNQKGDVVFQAQVVGADGAVDFGGVYRWDAGKQQVMPIAVKGTRTRDNIVLGLFPPFGEAINNQGEITFTAGSADATGKLVAGLFLRDSGGSVRSVALDDQPLPNGDKIGSVIGAVLDDNGVIALQAAGKRNVAGGLYRWEKGALTATGVVGGASAPGGGTFVGIGAGIEGVGINPKDGSLLVAAELAGNPSGLAGLYRFAAGQLSAAVVPGQTMPDGVTNAGPPDGDWQFSPFNAAGQVVFITGLADGSKAAYVMEADGKLTLLLKEGMTTSLGTVTAVGSKVPSRRFARFPVGLNNHGQVALPVELTASDAQGDAILLLTPQ